MASLPPVIEFDYEFSPHGQKIRLLLAAAGIPFHRLDVPVVLPRPDLERLGITYRRVPLLSIGRDVFADTRLICSAITSYLAPGNALPSSPADDAFAEWASTLFFNDLVSIIPSSLLDQTFLSDRKEIFPSLLRPDFATLRPSGLAALRSRLATVEREFLASANPFIDPSSSSLPSRADVHLIWPIRWAFANLSLPENQGFSPADLPKIHALIRALPEPKFTDLSAAEAGKLLASSPPANLGPQSVMKDDPLELPAGSEVNVECLDTTPGAFPQVGKLVASDVHSVVIEIKDGIRMHFPRVGTVVRSTEVKW